MFIVHFDKELGPQNWVQIRVVAKPPRFGTVLREFSGAFSDLEQSADLKHDRTVCQGLFYFAYGGFFK